MVYVDDMQAPFGRQRAGPVMLRTTYRRPARSRGAGRGMGGSKPLLVRMAQILWRKASRRTPRSERTAMTEPRHPWTPGHLLSTALVAGMISGYVLAGWALVMPLYVVGAIRNVGST